MKKYILSSLAVALALGAVSPAARADDAKLIGTYGAWSAYVFTEDNNKVCYVASQPVKAAGKYKTRGDVFALITHRPAEGTKNVFSYITGYAYKPGSDAAITIDSNSYNLFTQDDTAWAPDGATDGKIANGVRKGAKMSVKGTSARGTATVDNFSLKGSGAALDAINKGCGI